MKQTKNGKQTSRKKSWPRSMGDIPDRDRYHLSKLQIKRVGEITEDLERAEAFVGFQVAKGALTEQQADTKIAVLRMKALLDTHKVPSTFITREDLSRHHDSALSKRTGVPISVVRLMRYKVGIPPPPRSTSVVSAEAWGRVDFTLSNAELSRQLGVSETTVARHRKALGLAPHKRGRPEKKATKRQLLAPKGGKIKRRRKRILPYDPFPWVDGPRKSSF